MWHAGLWLSALQSFTFVLQARWAMRATPRRRHAVASIYASHPSGASGSRVTQLEHQTTSFLGWVLGQEAALSLLGSLFCCLYFAACAVYATRSLR